jgi:hypothetical protein
MEIRRTQQGDQELRSLFSRIQQGGQEIGRVNISIILDVPISRPPDLLTSLLNDS